MPWEILRRVSLAAGLAASAWLAAMTPSRPFLELGRVDFAAQQKDSYRPTPDGRAECELSAQQFIAWRTKGRVIPVAGPPWQAWFDQVEAALAAGKVPKGWTHRVPAPELRRRRFTRLHFWAQEPPLSEIASRFSEPAAYYLALPGTAPRYLQAYYRPRLRAAALGSGFWGTPTAFAYPLRRFAAGLALLTWLIYGLLPWPRRTPEVSAPVRWRVVGIDLAASLLLFLPFFSLPLLIVGSAQQAATEYLLFSLVFWAVSSLGLLALYWGAVWGSFQVQIADRGLRIHSLWGAADFTLSDLAEVRRAAFRPPHWLIRGMRLLSLLGGRRGMLAAGQASILASSEARGLRLRSRGGRSAFIWYTDQTGGMAMQNFKKVESALAGRISDAPILELSGVFPPFR
ncbi:MAG: hypothetical protein WC881_05800 [Elusimicrobiota bacterium]|jgi:hypothetical protein